MVTREKRKTLPILFAMCVIGNLLHKKTTTYLV